MLAFDNYPTTLHEIISDITKFYLFFSLYSSFLKYKRVRWTVNLLVAIVEAFKLTSSEGSQFFTNYILSYDGEIIAFR